MILFLLQVVVISLSGVLAPGPVMTSAIAQGTKSRHAGFFISLGHSAIELPLLAAIALGIGFIFEYPAAKIGIGLVGGLYMLWMGWGMFKESYHPRPNCHSRAGGNPRLDVADTATNPFITGLVLSATNPYFLLWWATVGLNLAKDAAGFGVLAIILFAIVHSLCDMTWLEIISFTSYKGSRLLSEKNQKNILIICAAAIIFFGFYFIIKSLLLN
jgi:threonine/homoserine/homoserine lactone efflux protein